MGLIMRNNKRKIQKKMIVTYALSGVILTGLLSFLSSRIITTFLVNQSVDYATQSLEVTANSVHTLLDEVYSEFYFLFSENTQVINFRANNEGVNSTLTSLLVEITLSDPLVDSIILYNTQSDEVVLSNNQRGLKQTLTNQPKVESLNEIISNLDRDSSQVFYHQQVNDKNMLAMVFSSVDATNALSSLMVVYIDEQMLSSLFTSMDANYDVLLVNDKNVVVADSSQQYIGETFAIHQPFTNPMHLDESNNYFISEFDQEESLIAFKKSDAYNIVFFHITPYSIIYQTLVQTNRTLVWLFLLFAIANVLFSLYSSKQFYSPIQQIMDQFIHKDYTKAKDEFEVIESAFTDLNLNNQLNVLRQLFTSGNCSDDCDVSFIKFPIYVVVMIYEQELSETTKQDIDPIWPIIQVQEDTIAGIITKDAIDNLDVSKFDGVFGFSKEVNFIEDIRKNYRYALAAAQFSKTLENSNLTYYDDIYQHEYLTSKSVLHQDTLAYIHKHGLLADFTSEQLADELGFSLGYVRQVFKEIEKTSLNEYIIDYRIEKAKEMLLSTDLSGREISEAIGYSDSRYFYTQFKRRVNMTIEEFRHQNKEVSDDE